MTPLTKEELEKLLPKKSYLENKIGLCNGITIGQAEMITSIVLSDCLNSLAGKVCLPMGRDELIEIFDSYVQCTKDLKAERDRYKEALQGIVNYGYTAEEIEEVKNIAQQALKQTRECPECKGKGTQFSNPETFSKCSKCNGKGTVEVKRILGRKAIPEIICCLACNGTGKVQKG